MSEYRFFHAMEIRYGDLDPQGHLNNAKYLTYFEQARVLYLSQLGLLGQEQTFVELGVIVADIHIKYHAPVFWGASIQVGVRTVRIGNRSLTIEQCVVDKSRESTYASGTVILVAYDYTRHETTPVPDAWRRRIEQFEGGRPD